MLVERSLIKTKSFKDNYGTLLVWSGLYNESLIYPLISFLFLATHAVFLGYTVVLAQDDIKLKAESAHFTVFRTALLVMMANSLVKKSDLKMLFGKLSEATVHDYENSLNEECQNTVNSRRRKCDHKKKLYGTFFVRSSTVVITMFLFRTAFEYYSGHLNHPQREDYINENLPVSTYLPYDSAEWPGYQFAVLSELYLTIQAFVILLGVDCSFICFSEEFLRELDIIIITLSEVHLRSKHLRKELQYKISQNDSIHRCLKHSVQHHQKVIKLFSHFQSYCFYSLFFTLSVGAFLICLSSLMMTSDEISFKDKSMFVSFLLNECFHIFIFCYYGELIMNKSEDLGDTLYNCGWTEIADAVKPFYILIKLRCQTPLALSAGGFMTAGYQTYGNVLRTAYSYLNLLTATN